MIVVLADVAQDQGCGGGIELVAEVVADHFIRKVSVAAHHALLYGPGVRADLQHVEIVIGFEQQHVGAAQMELDGIGNVAEVGDDADVDALRVKTVAHGIDGVVGDGEAVDVDIADGEARASLETLQARRGVLPIDERRGLVRHVDGGGGFFRETDETGDVIAMLVGDEDGVEATGLLTDGGEPPGEFLEAEAGVDEDAGPVGRDECAIAGAAAREHAEFDDDGLPWNSCSRKERGEARDAL